MADNLDILLVEDNPGDARLIDELLQGERAYLDRIDLGDSTPKRTQIHHATTLDAGLDRLAGDDFDVVLLDLDLPDSGGLDTVVRVTERCGFIPVIVLTGLDDRDLGIESIRTGAKDYLVKGEVTGEELFRAIQHAIEVTQREVERARHREQLRALNHLNRIGQDVTHAVITRPTREELERAVCERFAESDAYQFAWMGEIHRPTGRLSPRVTAPVDAGYLDDAEVPVGDGTAVEGPASSALRTRETRVVRDIQSDPDYAAIRERLSEQPYRSIAAIPIAHEGVFYGILVLHAGSPTAFSDPEIDVLERLCDVVGHAIAAIERKDALVEDTVLQLEFRIDGVATPFVARSVDRGCTVEFGRVIRTGDGLLVFGRIEGLSAATAREVADETGVIDGFDVRAVGDDELTFEATTRTADALVGALAAHGGNVASGSIEDGEFRVVVEFPSGRDKRQLVDLVEHHCPGATIRAQRTVQRDDPGMPDTGSVFQNRLTEKQRNALETAFNTGYFDWPRRNSGDEVADRLGISQATFSQHLRAAERKFFAAVFEADDGSTAAGSNWSPLGPEASDD